jgi:hypothetical protein
MRPVLFAFSTVLLLNPCSGAQSPASRAVTPAPAAKIEIRPVPPELSRRFEQLYAALKPYARDWVNLQAKIEAQRLKPNLDALRVAIRLRFVDSHPDNSTVETVVALVLLQMAKDGDSALAAQISQVFALQKEKQDLQTLADQLSHEAALAKESKRAGACLSSLCVSLPSKLAQLNAASANLPHPIHLQASANLTYQQLAMVQANVALALNTLNEDNQRESASNRVQSDNQNANTVYNQLESILKNMNDTQESAIHNLL